jgi:DNA-binding NarL/FixJ family response regulator
VSQNERRLVAFFLLLILLMVTADILTDSREGTPSWHLMMEGAAGLVAALGVSFLIKDSFSLKHSLENERRHSQNLQLEAAKWQEQAKKFLDGLSQAIETQLTEWQLTSSEKEVAFLLLKGLSLRQIAEIRQTSEKTARAQSTAIYSKSGLAGRSELAAFFLEDLLVPNTHTKS